MKKYIPNAFTMGNLLSGCIAVLYAANDQLVVAAIFVAIGVFFDFFDGFFARILKVESEVGLQLDSLADMVTSGLVPGMVMYKLLNNASDLPWGDDPIFKIGYIGFAVTLASAFRLAKFNVDTRQTTGFIGLPTPANTLLIISLPLIYEYSNWHLAQSLILNPYFLIALTAVSCFVLNAELPLFGLKFKNWNWKENRMRYLFLICAVSLLVWLQFLAIPLIILIYILMSLSARK